MKDLIVSEWRRFRLMALAAGLAHGLALLLMSRAMDVLQLGYEDQAAFILVYMLLGLTLALLQVGSYRQTSRWLWLIHRPLPPSRIFAALAVSALAQLSVAILLPLLIFVIGTHMLTTHVVDLRHYAAIFYAVAFAVMAWLAGAHASTSRSKAAVAVLLAPIILALHPASAGWLLLPVITCIAWLAFIARHSFRADRSAPIARHTVLLLSALPLQLGFFLLVFQLSRGGVALVDLLGRSPGRTVLQGDSDVDVDAMVRNLTQAFVAKGLEGSADPRVAGWREQLPLLRYATLQPDLDRFPVRHQLGNVAEPWWDDERSIKWTFSHDRMMYHGRNPTTGESRGWWGTGGIESRERFAEVPASGMTRSMLFAIDHESQRQHELIRLRAGEWFVGKPVQALDRVLLQTNKRVLAYRENRETPSRFAPPILDWQLALDQDEFAPMVNVFELLDGWLVSLHYFDSRELASFASLNKPWQQIVYIDAAGQPAVVGERLDIRGSNVSLGGSTRVPVSSWWVSPPLYALAHTPDLLDRGLTQRPRFVPLPRIPLFHALAVALMILSLALAHWWLRGTRVSPSRRGLWLVSCALIGFPAFLSLVCLEPRQAACS